MVILLWQIRNERKLTLKQLSELTGVSVSEINAIENQRVSPKLETLAMLAKGLGCKISDLYKE